MHQICILVHLNSTSQDAHFIDEKAEEMERASMDFLQWEMG